jgi:hypothetical protein
LTSTGPSSATLQQIKEAPVGTQSLGEQRLSAFEGDLEKAFRPLVRGWQPGQAPLTQEQYDKIQRASIDLFDKLGYLNPMGAQPSRVAAASMRKGTRPPPRTYAEAKTPQATEVEFQHASPHKFTNVDEANPFGKFDELHLLKGEGATVYGPGAAYVSTSEPTHRSYLHTFRGKNITRDSFTPIEQQFGPLPKFLEKELVVRPWTHPSRLEEILAKQELQIDKSLQQYKTLAADPQNTTQQKEAWKTRIAAKEQELKDLQAADSWLQPIIKTGKSFEDLGLDTRAYSYRGSLAEDPARTVLFDKSLAEQTPEVQAALARASSSVRRALGKTNSPMPPKLFNLTPEQEKAFIEYANIRGDRSDTAWDRTMNLARTNPKVLLQDPKLTPEARDAVEALIAQQTTNVRQSKGAAGEYIKDYRASPKTVQRLRDAGIDLIKYQGSSQSPNYVVVNPAAAKIRTRTPSIAATFGTGELARQLYESIYGKDAQ